MGQFLVRNLDGALIEPLRARAVANGRSVETEHREILKQALGAPWVPPTAPSSRNSPRGSAR